MGANMTHSTLALTLSETPHVFIVFEEKARQVGQMSYTEYQRFVQSHVRTEQQAQDLLEGIETWNNEARWYTLGVLMESQHLRIYHTRVEAEQAMRGAA